MTEKTFQINLERAWKDQSYRDSLTPEQLKNLPPNPAGEVELSEAELEKVVGGGKVTSAACFKGDKSSPNTSLL